MLALRFASCVVLAVCAARGRALTTTTPPPLFDALPRPYVDACISPLLPRLTQYCNSPPPGPSAAEGAPPFAGAELLHVVALFRHGDRSAIHSIPAHAPIDWPCSEPNDAERAWASAALVPLHSSPACATALLDPATAQAVRVDSVTGIPAVAEAAVNATAMGGASSSRLVLPPECVLAGAGEGGVAPSSRVRAALELWRTPRAPGQRCHPEVGGELSSVGWAQLVAVGRGLARSYSRALLLRDDPRSEPIRVLTTDTGRTALSATAVVRGLLQGAAEAAAGEEQGVEGDGSARTRRERLLALRLAAADAAVASASAAATAAGAPPEAASASSAEALEAELLRLAVPQLRLPLPLHIVNRSQDPAMWARRHALCPEAHGRLSAEPAALEHLLRHELAPAGAAAALMASGRLAAAARSLVAASEALSATAGAAAGGAGQPRWPKSEAIADDLYTRLCHGLPLPCGDADAPPVPDPAAVCPPEDGRAAAAILRRARRAAARVWGTAQLWEGAAGAGAGHEDEERAARTALAHHHHHHHHHLRHPEIEGGNSSAASEDDDIVEEEDEDDEEEAERGGEVEAGLAAASSLPAPHHCMRVSHAAAALAHGDALYARAYATNATGLLMYPLLAQITAGMRAAAAGTPGHTRLVLRAAHDTVLAPLAHVLRVQRSGPSWPGYAARLSLELWGGSGGAGEGGPAAWVRALYQGEDVTHLMPCAPPQPQGGRGGSLCSLAGFEEMLRALLGGAPSWEEACGATHDDASVREA